MIVYIILVVAATSFNIFSSLILKYFSSINLRKILKNDNEISIKNAINEINNIPIYHSLLAFFEWTFTPLIFIFIPFIIGNKITFIEFLHSTIFTFLTAIVLTPLYYLLVKNEFIIVFDWLKDIKDLNSHKSKIKISISLEILFVLIISILYPSGNLTFLIYLSNNNFINLNRLNLGIVLIFFGSIVISVIEGIILSKIYSKTFIKINEKLKNISSGNLNQTITITANNEFGDMSFFFNDVIKKLYHNVQSIKNSTIKLAEWINKLSNNSSELAKTSEIQANSVSNVTTTIEEYTATISSIKININNQANNLIKMTSSMKKLLEGMQYIINNTKNVSEKINENIINIKSSQEKLNKSIDGAIKMNSNMNDISLKIKNVGDESENIDKILNVIEDISEKTNLLAINTAIEAAHAGEYGKGFAIVAGEIKKLADNSKKSVKEISELIKKIKIAVSEAINITQTGNTLSNKNKLLSEESGDAMQKVINNIEKIKIMINEITSITNAQGDDTNELLKFIESLKGFSDEIKTQMEEQTIAVNEIMKSITEVNSSTENNSIMAENLSNLTDELQKENENLEKVINQFKI
jgi:methyl-accepting chemotaxis protein